tara:strand:+ start:390 stop:734 length:345 start_codon:yes stop_codon:yes gene_type:complete
MDRFGYGTKQAPSREEIADYFLKKYNFKGKAYDKLKDYLSTPYKDEKDLSEIRAILKAIYPESGLLTMNNKKTGDSHISQTWTGDNSDRFNQFREMSKILFMAKGVPETMLRNN